MTMFSKRPGVAVLVMLACLGVAEADKRCFECNDVPHPADCKIVTTCTDFEECVVREYISSGGLVLYSSGCESKLRCQSLGKRHIEDEVISDDVRTSPDVGSLAKKQTSDIIVCEECCDSEFCNIEGCGITISKQPQRGPLCFHCRTIEDPAACRVTTECEKGQVCALYKDVETRMYRTTCLGELVCTTLSKVHASRGICYECCTADFCNDHCDIQGNTTAIIGRSLL